MKDDLFYNDNFIFAIQEMVAVAQLVRALVCGAGSRGFESHQPPKRKELN